MTAARSRVAIIGASGYTGAELVRLVWGHPALDLGLLAARDRAGQRLGDVVPSTEGVEGLCDLVLEAFEPERASEIASRADVAFTALPHGSSARSVQALHATGMVVVDLSADFRLRDADTYEKWYGPHPARELCDQAVYGLPELHRQRLRGARLIAAPGCYPTSSILPLAPLLESRLVEPSGIVIDSKSGVSGAGRSPAPSAHFPEASEGIRPYKVAGAHRHIPEIEQELSAQAGQDVRVVFTPHLAPFSRGILTTAYARPRPGTTEQMCREAAQAQYAGGLVTVLEKGRLPDTLWVRGSARAYVAYALDERVGTVIAMCAIDNLAKGASSQALQALNAALGLSDGLGLPLVGTFP